MLSLHVPMPMLSYSPIPSENSDRSRSTGDARSVYTNQVPWLQLKEFTFTQGSYVDWRGYIMNPRLNLTASERVRASVSDGDNSSRHTDFDVSVSIKNTLEAPDLSFDLSAPNDGNIQKCNVCEIDR